MASFRKRSSPKNDYNWQEKQPYEDKCETREHAVSMRISRLLYACYLIGSSKINSEQEIGKSVLNGGDVGDINYSSQIYSEFMLFVSEKVTEWLKSFFRSRLDHIGCKSPVNLRVN